MKTIGMFFALSFATLAAGAFEVEQVFRPERFVRGDTNVRKQQEIEEARRTAEAHFNETTGAYSVPYGADGINEKHREQIDAILAEKDDALRDLIERTGEE